MSSTWTLKEKSQGELLVTIDGEKWEKAQKKAYDKISKSIKIDGFRQGQVPAAILKKRVSKEQIMMEAVDFVSQDAVNAGIEENKIDLISRPVLDVKEMTESSITLSFMITVRPEVKLGKYKGLKIKEVELAVSDEEVNDEINRHLAEYADVVIKEGEDVKVEKGDIAVIDFEGFTLDDVPFDGGKGEKYPLEIGSGSFIPGFEEQLIGVKLGSRKKVKVTFPADYQAADLAGKEVYFKCKVNEIKVKKTPELTDELVVEQKAPNCKTVAEFKTFIKGGLETKKKQEGEAQAFDEVMEKVLSKTEVEIPEVMIQEESDNLMIEFSQRLQQSGYSIEMFMQATGNTQENIKQQMWEDANARVKTRLVLEAIAKAEDLKVTPEEIDAEYENLAKRYNMEIEKVRQMARVDLVGYDIVLRKASDFVRESCK